MKRLLLLIVALAIAVVVAALTVPSDAASVNGVSISTSTLNGDLTAIGASPGYQCYLDAQVAYATQGRVQSVGVDGVGANRETGENATDNSTFVGFWLNQLISNEEIAQLVSSRGLVSSAGDLVEARAELADDINGTFLRLEQLGLQPRCTATGASVLASMPGSFVQEQTLAQANNDLLEAYSAGSSLSAASLRRYFVAHRSTFDTLCVSDIAASSQADIDTLRSQVVSGTPFADVAKSSSLDTQSAPSGGVLGCVSPGSSGYAVIASHVAGLAAGDVSKSFSQQSAYFILQLTAHKPANFGQAREAVRQSLLSSGSKHAGTLLQRVAIRSQVHVDPRYGRWTSASVAQGLFPPIPPPPSTLLSPAANNPNLTAAASTAAPPVSGATGGR